MKKKLLALVLAATMSMALMACGGSKEVATESVATEETAVEETAEEVTVDMSEEKAAMKEVFTTAVAGADEDEYTYWFLFNDDVTFGAFVVLSADYTQSLNVVGEITEREDGALVITDETTSTSAALTVVEEGEDYIVVSLDGEIEITMVGYDVDEAIDVVLAIDETTEIIE